MMAVHFSPWLIFLLWTALVATDIRASAGKGRPGRDGKAGRDGRDGLAGNTGPRGNSGLQGKTGPQGNPGQQGEQGPQGNTSLPGQQGPEGKQGPQGNQGIQGKQGPQGNTGAVGKQGIQGPKGEKGYNGTGQGGASPVIGFTVSLQKHFNIPSGYRIIPWDTVKSNVGGGYDNPSHSFICKVAGLYQFNANVVSQAQNLVAVYLVHNGNAFVYGHASALSKGRGTASMQGVLLLKPNDKVWVNGSPYVYGYSSSNFSGFLIQRS